LAVSEEWLTVCARTNEPAQQKTVIKIDVPVIDLIVITDRKLQTFSIWKARFLPITPISLRKFNKKSAMTSKVVYTGGLHCEATHLRSGTTIETDAPTDNHGKGERFSPTDLTATSLATCIVTTIGILAPSINIVGAECHVEKVMASNPRRISEIVVTIDFPKSGPYTDQDKERIKYIADTCPVNLTLHPDCKRTIIFNWPE
jgi:putative redox protein